MNVTFIGVLQAIGKEFEKGLAWAVEYAVPVEKLVALIFPAAAPEANTLVDATILMQCCWWSRSMQPPACRAERERRSWLR
jgi:hypothetical protein